jgi:hypothetical protein
MRSFAPFLRFSFEDQEPEPGLQSNRSGKDNETAATEARHIESKGNDEKHGHEYPVFHMQSGRRITPLP